MYIWNIYTVLRYQGFYKYQTKVKDSYFLVKMCEFSMSHFTGREHYKTPNKIQLAVGKNHVNIITYKLK